MNRGKNKEEEMEINLIHKRKGGVSHLHVSCTSYTEEPKL